MQIQQPVLNSLGDFCYVCLKSVSSLQVSLHSYFTSILEITILLVQYLAFLFVSPPLDFLSSISTRANEL